MRGNKRRCVEMRGNESRGVDMSEKCVRNETMLLDGTIPLNIFRRVVH